MTFINAGGRSHDFTAREFFKAARITSGKAPGGKIELHGGERATVDLVPAAGVYKVHCSKFMHSSLGMKGSIVVQ
jgi:plastocyanin